MPRGLGLKGNHQTALLLEDAQWYLIILFNIIFGLLMRKTSMFCRGDSPINSNCHSWNNFTLSLLFCLYQISIPCLQEEICKTIYVYLLKYKQSIEFLKFS